MSTRIARSWLVLSSLSFVACAPPQLVCPEGFALSPEGRCLASDAGTLAPVPDGSVPDGSTPAIDAGIDAGSDAAMLVLDVGAPGTDAYVEGVDAFVAPMSDACAWGTWYLDADHDGHGAPAISIPACSQPAGYVASSDDCNDANATIYAGAPEICDGMRNDCSTAAPDAELLRAYYLDCDGDGFAASTVGMIDVCRVPTPGCGGQYVLLRPTDATNTDCADGDPTLSPTTRWYPDCDGDGHVLAGASAAIGCTRPSVRGCSASTPIVSALPGSWTTRSPTDQPDCWDLDGRAYPGSTTVSTDPLYLSPPTSRDYDYDCDGVSSPVITAAQPPRAGAPSCDGLVSLDNCRPSSPTWSGAAPACGNVGTLYQCGSGPTSCVVTSQTNTRPNCH